jgi:signal transduction histidine kinase
MTHGTTVAEPTLEHVLVVDDEAPVRFFVRDMLRTGGFEVDEARSLGEASTLLEQQEYGMVILDILLGDGSGLNFIPEVLKKHPECSVVMLSGRDDPQAILEAIRNGAEDYIIKPTTGQIIRLVVDRVAERRRLRRENLDYRNQLEQSVSRLQKLQQLKDDMTSMVIHDLKQPLTQILGCLELCSMTGQGSLAQRQHEYLASMRAGCDEMMRMVQTLLNIVQMEEGEIELDVSAISARSLLEGTLNRNRAMAVIKRHELRMTDPPDLFVHADPSLLNRMLDNLVGNALKYTPEGCVVTLAVEEGHGPAVRISVADNGPGIPEQYHDRLFQRFAQRGIVREAGRGDTGLGLAFCKMAAELHNGSIRLESKPGAGCTFTITLPKLDLAHNAKIRLKEMPRPSV